MSKVWILEVERVGGEETRYWFSECPAIFNDYLSAPSRASVSAVSYVGTAISGEQMEVHIVLRNVVSWCLLAEKGED